MTTPTQQPAPPSQRPTATQMAALVALVAAQAKVRSQLTQAAIAAAVAAFSALAPGDWWEGKKTSQAVKAALKVVQANQKQAARVTSAYMARSLSVLAGRRVAPAGAVDITRLRRVIPQRIAEDLVHDRITPAFVLLGELDPQQRRVVAAPSIADPMPTVVPDPGITVSERIRRQRADEAAAETADPGLPYGRVADQYRFQVVTKDLPPERSRAFALARIAAVAETDITLAVREQVRANLIDARDVQGYRRILRPELSESGPCGLCVVAADRLYKVQDLKPIHDRCCCEVLPIVGDLDPGIDLNREDLDRIYATAGSTGGSKRERGALKKIRVAIAENGELGPVLVNADHHHRGPREVALTKTADKKVRLQHQLDGWETEFARLIRRRESGEDVERPLRWQEQRIEQLRRELASV